VALQEGAVILAGDLGGTKVALGLFEKTRGDLRLLREGTYASHEYSRFEDALVRFLREPPSPAVTAACLAVAGPVEDGRVHATNLPWTLEETALARTAGIPRVRLLNDLAATAYGVLALAPTEETILNAGIDRGRRGNIAVIAAGTGLGEAILYWDGARHHVLASEGGHADFAPRSDLELDLLRYLRERHGHVSYERVLSGPGLYAIYSFLRDSGYAPEPEWLAAELAQSDPSAAITHIALSRGDRLCVAAVETFCSIYGAEAGNLALKCLAVEVAVAGGIAPKMLAALKNGSFMTAFAGKGRFADHMRDVTVTLVLNPDAALLGAAHCAAQG
jgi:glucokinase